jgi:hypothetical protein
MLVTWTRSQQILNENSKIVLDFEFDSNSKKFDNLN